MGDNIETTQIFNEILESFQKGINGLIEVLKPLIDKIKEAFEELQEAYRKTSNSESRKRYKVVRKLEINIHPIFLKRKVIYHCRNNC